MWLLQAKKVPFLHLTLKTTPGLELLQVSSSVSCLLTMTGFWIVCDCHTASPPIKNSLNDIYTKKAFWRFITQIPVVDSGCLRGRGGKNEHVTIFSQLRGQHRGHFVKNLRLSLSFSNVGHRGVVTSAKYNAYLTVLGRCKLHEFTVTCW